MDRFAERFLAANSQAAPASATKPGNRLCRDGKHMEL
jgi:hypothetical protein